MNARQETQITVLLVEDDDRDVRLVREAFDELAIETSVRVVSDGDEALETLTDRGGQPPRLPDLILLDLGLPRTGGLEFLQALSEKPELVRLPVLVLTESATVEDVQVSYERAANAYLTKPTTPDGYAEMVEAIADFWFRRAVLPTTASSR